MEIMSRSLRRQMGTAGGCVLAVREGTMQNIRVKRSGRPDLLFTGVRLAEVDERRVATVRDHWWEVSLFKTCVGKYLLASAHRCRTGSCRRVLLSFPAAWDLVDFLQENVLAPSISEEVLSQAMDRDEDLFQAASVLLHHRIAC